MNRYLTDKATEKRRWEIPVGGLSVVLGIIAVQVWSEDTFVGEDFVIWLLAHLVVTGLMLLPLFLIIRRRVRQRLAQRFAKKLIGLGAPSIPLARLDTALGVRNAEKKLMELEKLGFLQELETDGVNLILDDEAEPEPPREAPAPATDDVLRQIRALNDEIDDEAVSGRIDRIEAVTASILQTLRERPERAEDARRFMNYYLPATLKLLESYSLMEKQSYQGKNIRASRRQIEEVLDKIVTAAEKQQDKLFSSEALNVEAEISVLETMMASDGLTGGTRG